VARTGETGGGVIHNTLEFIQQVRTETAKVTWPTRRETTMTAVMVVVMTTVLALFFLGVDNVFNFLAQELLKLVG
jgi:preprotein translocase subunit SecE